ncbi:hypothetical protein CDV36_014590 [Fusarium kuroshium]|uniref:Uncharacterized protein n=1 Tax=Fusarium kuroshium TaxID=2010991 RepID=A0A3M2RHM6_9HYPO|nr:hypothetical protein CDV36_014590 [Fusarium kuroshium]
MSSNGFLVPDSYVFHAPNDVDMNCSSIFWGFSFAFVFFAALRAATQTLQTWRRKHHITAYIVMIWVGWAANLVLGAFAWCFQRGFIKPSFQLFFLIACFWSLQIQLLTQIIVNRLAFLTPNPAAITRLRWIVFLLILLVNISVMVTWVPAQLQISHKWMRISEIWERCEMAIFSIIDLSLNLRFVQLVRNRMTSHALNNKYLSLFQFNCGMILASISLDVALIGLMSLPSKLVYLQFHSLAFLVKLFIEMNMSDLITKVAQDRNRNASDRNSRLPPADRTLSLATKSAPGRLRAAQIPTGNGSVVEVGPKRSSYPADGRIHITVETAITRKSIDSEDDTASQRSLTRGM